MNAATTNLTKCYKTWVFDWHAMCVCVRACEKWLVFSDDFVFVAGCSLVCVQTSYCQCTCVNNRMHTVGKIPVAFTKNAPHLLVNCLKCKVKKAPWKNCTAVEYHNLIQFSPIFFSIFFVYPIQNKNVDCRSKMRMQTCKLSCYASTTKCSVLGFFCRFAPLGWKKIGKKFTKSRKMWRVKKYSAL